MNCSRCGNGIKPGRKFCTKCGTPVQLMQSCPRCGRVNEKQHKFCTKCGMSLTKVQYQVTKMKEKKSNRKVIGLTSFAAVFLALCIFLNFVLLPLTSNTLSTAKFNFEDPPSLETIITSSPFLVYDVAMPTEIGKDHNKFTKGQIDDALEIAETMMEDYQKLKNDIYNIYDLVLPLIEKADEEYGTDYFNNSQALKELEELQATFEFEEITYYSLEVKDYGDPLVNSDVSYAKVMSAIRAGEYISEAYTLLTGLSSTMYTQYENDSIRKISNMASAINEFYDESNSDEYMATLVGGTYGIYEIIEHLNVANAYLALNNMDYVKDNMDDMKDDIESLRDEDIVDLEFVELTEMAAYELEAATIAFRGELINYLDEVDFAVEDNKSILRDLFTTNTVYAADDGWGNSYLKIIKQPSKAFKRMGEKQREWIDQVRKDGLWNTACKGAKKVQETIGSVVETVDECAYKATRFVIGATEGNNILDIAEDFDKRSELTRKRKNAGKGGEEVYKDMLNNLDDAQNMVSDGWYNIGAFWEDEFGLPQDTIAQVGSTMGNIAAGTFTQMGQGLSRLLNPNSTKEDLAQGCIEITFAVAGGSNNVFSATKSGHAVLGKMGSLLKNPKLTKQAVVGAIDKVKNMKLSQLGSKSFRDSLTKAMTNFFSKVAGNAKENLATTLKEEISSLFMKNWRESLKGFRNYANAVASNVDGQAYEVFDHFLNGYLDNKITAMLSDKDFWKLTDEQRVAVINKEIDKIKEDVEKGLDEIKEQLEKEDCYGVYSGTIPFQAKAQANQVPGTTISAPDQEIKITLNQDNTAIVEFIMESKADIDLMGAITSTTSVTQVKLEGVHNQKTIEISGPATTKSIISYSGKMYQDGGGKMESNVTINIEIAGSINERRESGGDYYISGTITSTHNGVSESVAFEANK